MRVTPISFATLTPWAKHAARGRELVRRAFDVACRIAEKEMAVIPVLKRYLDIRDQPSDGDD